MDIVAHYHETARQMSTEHLMRTASGEFSVGFEGEDVWRMACENVLVERFREELDAH